MENFAVLNEDALVQRIAHLNQQRNCDRELKQLLDSRTGIIFRKVETTARSLATQADRDKLTLQRSISRQHYDLTKTKVELLRWRQRSALLKVQLSSAEEDVGRYQRVESIMLKQYQLEQESKIEAQRVVSSQLNAAELNHKHSVDCCADLQQLRNAIEDQTIWHESVQKKLQMALKTEKTLRHQVQGAEMERTQLELNVATALGAQAALEEEVRRLKADNTLLEKQRSYAKSAAEHRSSDCKELQLRSNTLQQEVSNKEIEIASLKQSLLTEQKQVNQLHNKLELLTKQLDAKRAQLQEMEKQAAARTVGAFISQLESPLLHQPTKNDYQGDHNMASQVDFCQSKSGRAKPAAPHDQEAGKGPSDILEADEEQKQKRSDAKSSGERKAGQARGKKPVSNCAKTNSNEAAAKDRPQRERNKSQPYWMGSNAAESEFIEPTKVTDQAAQRDDCMVLTQGAGDAGDDDNLLVEILTSMGGEHQEHQGQIAQKVDLMPVQVPAAAKSGRPRRQIQKQQTLQEQPDLQDTTAAEISRNKRRKGQLKRPQGEIKTNLTNLWGGATPVPAANEAKLEQANNGSKHARKSHLRPECDEKQSAKLNEEAVENDKHETSLSLKATSHQQPVISRVQERPLAPLNQRTLAAAANMMTKSSASLKGNVQKAIAARGENQQQPQKRKLLPVSTSRNLVGDILPAQALFGGSFKVPRLAK